MMGMGPTDMQLMMMQRQRAAAMGGLASGLPAQASMPAPTNKLVENIVLSLILPHIQLALDNIAFNE